MTTAPSLILIAVGAVLAFAVSFQVVGIDIQTVGVILIIVGAIGLAFSMAVLFGYGPWSANRAAANPSAGTVTTSVTPPTGTPPPTV